MYGKTLGIILAGGRSSRLFPATLITSKQLLPIYDKPLIYYPLTTLMLAGVKEFVIITSPKEKKQFEELLFDSETVLGIKVHFLVQEYPNGIAESFNIVYDEFGEKVRNFDRFALILGDNIFYGASMTGLIKAAISDKANAYNFAIKVPDPERFGVVEMDSKGNAISIEEKPTNPKSNYAVTGLYIYPLSVFDKVRKLNPSARGELEITDVNKLYLEESKLCVAKLLRGMVWFDTGTPDSMMEASQFVQTLQKKQDILVGSPHEVAYMNKWIDENGLMITVHMCEKTAYGKYLREIV